MELLQWCSCEIPSWNSSLLSCKLTLQVDHGRLPEGEGQDDVYVLFYKRTGYGLSPSSCQDVPVNGSALKICEQQSQARGPLPGPANSSSNYIIDWLLQCIMKVTYSSLSIGPKGSWIVYATEAFSHVTKNIQPVCELHCPETSKNWSRWNSAWVVCEEDPSYLLFIL